ncbi:tetratricopeptide repeat protein [Salinicola avicenniae]|uniref:tetratricopeptide repeat protein n=1 Tax=Salinicola avicenniae TaxID=2916836 RepID=UPI0020748A55|nr:MULTISPECIES: tetratricopeptide repeat protein [unclassified Salinicola]
MSTRLFFAAGCAALLAGCQHISTDGPSAPADDPMRTAPPITRGFDAQGLSDVLLSEMAGQRGDFQRAAEGYRAAAERYRSAALAERATLAARYTDDTRLLQSSADLWQRLAPTATAPRELLSGMAIDRGDWPTALQYRLALTDSGEDAQLLEFSELAMQAGADLPTLLAQLRDFARTHPTHADAQMATARLEAATGETDRAQQRLSRLAALHPEVPALWLTRSQIAVENGDNATAIASARRGLELAPDDSRFLLALAQAEIASGDIAAAEQRVDLLLARHDETPTLRLALARLYLEADALEPARRLLLPLLDRDETPPATYLLLGSIAETQEEPDNALLYYRQVPPGPGFLDARAMAVQMLVDADRLDDAQRFLRIESLRHPEQRASLTQIGLQAFDAAGHTAVGDELLDDALQQAPDDTDLLYAQAMRDYTRGDVGTMLSRLRRIIQLDPNDAAALNALGYTLTTTTERYDEALTLLERAHALEPDSPAILDSLGWAHFKRGDTDTALDYLSRAYSAQPDQEVGAHLAEVLATQGRTREARRIVEAALAAGAPHPDIDELLKRYPQLSTATDANSHQPTSPTDSTGRHDAVSPPGQ